MKPLILVIGPEGSGTTYIFRSLVNANPKLFHPSMSNGHVWPYAIFDRGPYPKWGIHHVSFPARRPCRWLEIENIPGHAKIVISTRNKKDSVASAHRRFGRGRATSIIEERLYERAISMFPMYRKTFETLDVEYEKLESQRLDIEKFLGLPGKWPPFEPRIRQK